MSEMGRLRENSKPSDTRINLGAIAFVRVKSYCTREIRWLVGELFFPTFCECEFLHSQVSREPMWSRRSFRSASPRRRPSACRPRSRAQTERRAQLPKRQFPETQPGGNDSFQKSGRCAIVTESPCFRVK